MTNFRSYARDIFYATLFSSFVLTAITAIEYNETLRTLDPLSLFCVYFSVGYLVCIALYPLLIALHRTVETVGNWVSGVKFDATTAIVVVFVASVLLRAGLFLWDTFHKT